MPPRLTPLPVRLARCLLGRFTVTTRAPLQLKRLPQGFFIPPASWNCQCLTDCRQSVCFAPYRDAAFDSIAGLARPHLATSRSVRSFRCHHLSTRVTSSNRSRRIRRSYPLTVSGPAAAQKPHRVCLGLPTRKWVDAPAPCPQSVLPRTVSRSVTYRLSTRHARCQSMSMCDARFRGSLFRVSRLLEPPRSSVDCSSAHLTVAGRRRPAPRALTFTRLVLPLDASSVPASG